MIKHDFLNEVVFGYIEKDLRNLQSYLPKKSGEPGNNNFTIALCILSYIEYLGSFFTLNDFNFELNVSSYIDKCFGQSNDYHPVVLKELFRNGLAHDYFARGGVSRDGIRPALYRNWEDKVILDADTLLEDFLKSLQTFADKLEEDKFNKRMEMAGAKIQKIERIFSTDIGTLPHIANIPHARTSGATVYPGDTKTTTTP